MLHSGVARLFPQRLSCFALVAAAVGLGRAGAARAAQFNLVDITYIHDTTSHYNKPKLSAEVPANWGAPVDFSNGRMYMRLEVLKKPNNTTKTAYLLCLIEAQDYTCSDFIFFSKPGIYEKSTDLSKFWQSKKQYDWKKKPSYIALIVKDPDNNAIDPGGMFAGAPDLGLYYPLTVRFTAWVATEGAMLDRSSFADGGPLIVTPRDAAAPDAAGAKDDGGVADAAHLDGTASRSEAAAGSPPVAADAGIVEGPDTAPQPTPDIGRTEGASPAPASPAPSKSSSGCAVGSGRSDRSSGGGWLAALALIFLAVRRRERA